MYELVWDPQAGEELRALSAFRRRIVLAAVERQLRHEPNVETSQRKPLCEPLQLLPAASWELRVGEFRVFYAIEEGQTVTILAIILKGTETTGEAVRRGRKP
jgi:mRNA-degrading endonuclease RelE of RelBE toxin-antitoxin system